MDLNIGLRGLYFQQYIVFLVAYISPSFPLYIAKCYDLTKCVFVSIFDTSFYRGIKSIYGVKNVTYSLLSKKVFGAQWAQSIVLLLSSEKSFGFISIAKDQDRDRFHVNLNEEKNRIEQLNDLYPQQNDLNCVHYSTMLWFKGSGQIKRISNKKESVLKSVCWPAEKLVVNGLKESQLI